MAHCCYMLASYPGLPRTRENKAFPVYFCECREGLSTRLTTCMKHRCSFSCSPNWASVSEPHTSVFNGEFVCAYGVRACVRTYALPHIVSRFNITFQIVSVIQWNLTYPAPMGPSLHWISETAGYVNRNNNYFVYTSTCTQTNKHTCTCIMHNYSIIIVCTVQYLKITRIVQEKSPASIASNL